MTIKIIQYKISGILVRISKAVKPSVAYRRGRWLGGEKGPVFFHVNVEGKRDTSLTLGGAKRKAEILATKIFVEKRKEEAADKKARDLFAATGVPF